MVDIRKIKENWLHDYIPDLDISKIKWSILNNSDFFKFLITNYYQDKEYIALPKLDGDELVPLGLTYTIFNDFGFDDSRYFISYILRSDYFETV